MVPPQAPGVTSSVYVITILGVAVQLSVAVAVPVFAGNKEAPQLTVIGLGQVIAGGRLSMIVTLVVV